MVDPSAFEASVPSELKDLIPVFLTNRREEVEALALAVGRGDLEQLRQIGHRMKGVGRSYGFDYVSDIGARIEQCARQADKAVLAALVEQYRDYLARVKIRFVEG